MSIAKVRKERPAAPASDTALEGAVEVLMGFTGLLRLDVERAVALSGLSQPMATALGRLARLPDPCTVSDLSRSLGCNMGNLSGTLERLAETGCIERTVGEADRRARFIRLTPKGRRLASQVTENFRAGRVWTAMKQLDVRQLEALTEIVSRLNGAAKRDAAS